MKNKGRDNRPRLKPVKKIELSEKNIKMRWILIGILLTIAIVAFGIGIYSFLNTEPGWNEVKVNEKSANCSSDFLLMYDFTDAGGSATAVNKKITSIYTEQTQIAYQVFSSDKVETKRNNLYYLNQHLNETVTVDPVLYKALDLIARYDSRYPYLAPVYTEYDRVFISDNDLDAGLYDPSKNPELMPYITEAVSFASDPEMIRLEIIGDNQVRLSVSEQYLSFIEEYGIETVFDFGWMKNGFIADHIADVLQENGFTNGYIASYDGFTRNLDSRGNQYSFNLFHRQGRNILIPAEMTYCQPMSIVFFRDFPLVDSDRWHYYAYGDGTVTSVYLDPMDGMSKGASETLVGYSGSLSCAEIMLEMAPVYITDSFDAVSVLQLSQKSIYSVWYEGMTLRYNDPNLKPNLLEVDKVYQYTIYRAE